MNCLIRNIDNYLFKNKSLKGFIPTFNKTFNPMDLSYYKQPTFKTLERNVIYNCKDYELILINWGLGAATNIHFHPNTFSIMHLLDGRLKEEFYNNKYQRINTKILSKGETSYISDTTQLHKVTNINKKSISFHIYSPPLKIYEQCSKLII